MERTVTPASWSALIEALYEGSWDSSLSRYRSHFAFRGMGVCDFDLKTSLIRLAAGTADAEVLERHLLRNFRKYAHSETGTGTSIWNSLAIAQHRGLPTRLLDWTYSPFVALHFATENLDRYDCDGVIWCVDYRKTNALLPARLKESLRSEGSDIFTVEMLAEVSESIRGFDQLTDDRFVVFLEPPSLDARIVNQYALFSLMSSPSARLDEWLQQHPAVFYRVVIPRQLKWEVRDKLDQANINERILFPGLDGLARWLTRFYRPAGNRIGAQGPSREPSEDQDPR